MNVSIHRFRDKIGFAFVPHAGETVYLTPKDARAIARALNKFARDAETTAFTDSKVAPVSRMLDA